MRPGKQVHPPWIVIQRWQYRLIEKPRSLPGNVRNPVNRSVLRVDSDPKSAQSLRLYECPKSVLIGLYVLLRQTIRNQTFEVLVDT